MTAHHRGQKRGVNYLRDFCGGGYKVRPEDNHGISTSELFLYNKPLRVGQWKELSMV